MEDLEDDVEPMKYATWFMALIIFLVIGTSATLGDHQVLSLEGIGGHLVKGVMVLQEESELRDITPSLPRHH